MSERMATAWDADSGADEMRPAVLHKMLYRLRKWTAGEFFQYTADELPGHDLFHHFENKHLPIPGLAGKVREERFDSTIQGGIPFFVFCQRHMKTYRDFCAEQVIVDLKKCLSNRNKNVLCDGIESMAYLFYLKFGGLHLPEAVYCLECVVTRLS